MAKNNGFRGTIIVAVLVVVGAIGAYIYSNAPLEPPAAAPSAAPAPAPARIVANTGPQFDIVRVDSLGNAVIAGRADAGAVVTIKDGNTLLGMVSADDSGAFAFVPGAALPPGAHQLTLSETLPDGEVIHGETSASVNVAASPTGQSLTVITGPAGSRIVSGQGPIPGSLGIGSVDYDANGHAVFSGTAPDGDRISLSLDNVTLGTAVAGPDGRWSFSASVPANSGMLQMTDETRPGSPPISAPFALETLKTAMAEGHVVIAPGQNLWLIARHIYGHGILYTLIYSANAKIIRNPNLIFPGQAFAIPAAK